MKKKGVKRDKRPKWKLILSLLIKLSLTTILLLFTYKSIIDLLFPYQSFFENRINIRVPNGWTTNEYPSSIPVTENINFKTVEINISDTKGGISVKITSTPGNVSVGYEAEKLLAQIVKDENYLKPDIHILSDMPDKERTLEINGINKYEKLLLIRRNSGEIYEIRGSANTKIHNFL